MKNIKIVFFGTPDFVVPVLDALHQHFTIVGVVTTPDAPLGRKQKLTPSPVKERALALDLPVFTPKKLDNELNSALTTLNSELIVVASYGKIIPQAMLDIPSKGAINIHPSLLPKYRGPIPVPAVILNGETETGISFIQMDDKIDHGPIIYQEKFLLTGQETSQSLLKDIWHQASVVAPQVVTDYLSDQTQPREQDHTQATFCQLMTKESGYFDLDNPPDPAVLDRMIRGLYPWPTAWTYWWVMDHGSRVKKIVKLLPGKLIQVEGKNPTSLKAFLNGYPDFPLKNL